MLFSLGDESRKLIGMEHATLLDGEQDILEANRDFFFRGGVHLLADYISDMHDVDPELTKHIPPGKLSQFMAMAAAVSDPKDELKDPVVMYGWSRTKNEAIMKKMQEQRADANTRLYLAGYKAKVPEFEKYLKDAKTADYWYKYFAWYLRTAEMRAEFASRAADIRDQKVSSEEGLLPPEQQTWSWGMKLSMLRYCGTAELKADKTNDVDHVLEPLMAECKMSVTSYALVINKETVERTREVSIATLFWMPC